MGTYCAHHREGFLDKPYSNSASKSLLDLKIEDWVLLDCAARSAGIPVAEGGSMQYRCPVLTPVRDSCREDRVAFKQIPYIVRPA